MALTDSTTLNADASAGGFFSKLSETLGNAVSALTPVATTVLTAKYTADAAKYDAKAKASETETGQQTPVNALAGSSGFSLTNPLVIIGGILVAVLTLGLVLRRR